MPRADWRSLRAALSETQQNATSLRELDSAAFSMSLEPDVHPQGVEEVGRLAHALGAANRWHDKSLQIVVFGNGSAAVIGSFLSGVEGSPGGDIAAWLVRRSREIAGAQRPAARLPKITSSPLEWTLDEAQRGILAAAVAATVVTEERAWFTFRLPVEALRRSGISPDASFHAALHLALLRVFGPDVWMEQREFVSLYHYENGSATSRSVCTPELSSFVDAVIGGETDEATLFDRLRAFSDVHREQIRRVRHGDLPLQRLAALALEDAELRAAYRRWVMSCKGGAMDVPFFWTRYGTAPQTDLLVLTSGFPLAPGLRLIGRFGIAWGIPRTLCVHNFEAGDRIDVVFHADPSLHGRFAVVAEALERALTLVGGLCSTVNGSGAPGGGVR
jgi:hypothetical protein